MDDLLIVFSSFICMAASSKVLFLFVVLCSYKRILVMISHSQDFLNGVCTNIIHMHKGKLVYYGVSKNHSQ